MSDRYFKDLFYILAATKEPVKCASQCDKVDMTCVQNDTWIQCKCVNNTNLNNERNCVDINECLVTPSVCNQGCINSRHSYICFCVNGYEMSKNQQCKAKGSPPLLFIPGDNNLKQLAAYQPKQRSESHYWYHGINAFDFQNRNRNFHRSLIFSSNGKLIFGTSLTRK